MVRSQPNVVSVGRQSGERSLLAAAIGQQILQQRGDYQNDNDPNDDTHRSPVKPKAPA
jgi:hypothetical protein